MESNWRWNLSVEGMNGAEWGLCARFLPPNEGLLLVTIPGYQGVFVERLDTSFLPEQVWTGTQVPSYTMTRAWKEGFIEDD